MWIAARCFYMRAETPSSDMQPRRDGELKIDAVHLLEWAVKSKLHGDCPTITALISLRCCKSGVTLSEVNADLIQALCFINTAPNKHLQC